ncbi:hypothetical protein So717_10210 [Roseobacter cerasinus]|uniref:Phytase-like domain-containing protein n=1 Tax=Roseobacter cerasinus TaxID=2602289 RepID=A0A640VLE9_9RHOB|nr:esterase-like activity of phytase family protein [Roseobacter cerasinus]GFE49268.1 hypothetical protein So717_10210 [Roseobacter cerasinus]
MRPSLAIALIALIGLPPVLVYLFPLPAPLAVPVKDQPAQHLSTYRWHHDAHWFGGFSGIELATDGVGFHAITDRGHLVEGTLRRSGDQITGATIAKDRPLTDDKGTAMDFPNADSEGLARDSEGRLFVSFEANHRIMSYDDGAVAAGWPGYTLAWRALHFNRGLEALAVNADGTVFTLPEGILRGASEALIYRRVADGDWTQPFTLPVDRNFFPVGADFGPDGRFYLLEREFRWFGFRSRVRAMTLAEDAVEDIELLMETPHRTYGNLEGLAVWVDRDGQTRLTMISDDNFLPVMRTEIVEYVLAN